MTIDEISMMVATWTEMKVKYPRHGIRWSAFASEFAYQFKCPGWVVVIVPQSWWAQLDALPGSKIPELNEQEFQEFFDEWTRHIQASSVTRDLNPCP